MIDIGINYLKENENQNSYDSTYKYLIEKGYINTLKFPGKHCTYNLLEEFLNFSEKMKCKVDIHGIPNMLPAIHSKKCLENVDFDTLKKVINNRVNRISTHIGLENGERLNEYNLNSINEILKQNVEKIKNELREQKIEIGLENIPGEFHFDKLTFTPEFISASWENVDFGVFDITHAKLASEELNMTYEEYLKQIKHKEKVKILHVSGNKDTIGKYQTKLDKHVLIHSSEIGDIIETIKEFPNLDLIVSEYAYNTKYSYEKEITIEAITLYTIVTTMNEEKVITKMKDLEKSIKDK